MRGQAHRHVGAGLERDLLQALVVERKAVQGGEQAQRGRGIGRTTANAGRDREHLVEGEMAELQIADARFQELCGLEHEIVGALAAGLRHRARRRQLQFRASHQRQAIGAIGERHHAFEVVIAVDAAPDHPQGQVDLGTRLVSECRHGNVPQNLAISRPCRLLFSCRRKRPKSWCPPAGRCRSWR